VREEFAASMLRIHFNGEDEAQGMPLQRCPRWWLRQYSRRRRLAGRRYKKGKSQQDRIFHTISHPRSCDTYITSEP